MPIQPHPPKYPSARGIRRRSLQKSAALILAAVSLIQANSPIHAKNLEEKPSKPNIILIMADDKYHTAA